MSESPIDVTAPRFGQQERDAVAEVVASGWIAQGPRVARFEWEFATAMQAPYAVAAASGTAALHLALIVAGVRPGDDVVVSSLSSTTTAIAVRRVGATPVFADVDPLSGTITGATVERALTLTTVAVIAVDHAGVPVDLHGIRAATDPLGIIVVEDASCGAGSTHHGRPVGAAAEITAWSFGPLSLLTTGEGGMVTTTHAAWAGRARRLREHPMSASATEQEERVLASAQEYGWDVRMTDLQAAVGLVQLARLPETVGRRRDIADVYRAGLAGVPGLRLVTDPAWGTGNAQSFWVEVGEDYTLDRDGLLVALAAADVSAWSGSTSAHRLPERLTGTERFTDRTLTLPIHHDLTADEQDRVIAVLRAPRDPAMAKANSTAQIAR